MKLKLNFETFSFHYKTPVVVGKKQLTNNTALVVHVSNDEGASARVHLTALPDFHHYNVNEWQFFLDDFFSREIFSFDNIQLSAPYFNTTVAPAMKGELLFAIESVLFAFIENYLPETLPVLNSRKVLLNGLYSEQLPFEEIPDCVKIKIRPTIKSMMATSNAVKELSLKKSAIRFRLDGNRTFELNELLFFLEHLNKDGADTSIEYIEEPFKNFNDTYAFKKLSPLPMALDESIIQFADKLDQFPDSFFILKPTLLGLSKSFELMNRFSPQTIISSSYEFPSALRPLLYLAALNPKQYHGLDTVKFLPKEFSIKTQSSLFLVF